MDVIKDPGKEAEPEPVSANKKLELWGYNANLVLKDGENIDMDLLNENRSFIHAGKFLQKSKTMFKCNRWTELFALLFDNYLVLTKPEEEDGVTKYQIYQRPIPLDLLTLGTFTDPPIRRGCKLFSLENDTRVVYPCTIHHGGRMNGRIGSFHTLFVESAQARLEWKAKLEEVIGLRRVVQESNKVFEVETLNVDTSFAPALVANVGLSCDGDEGNFTGKVTCCVPFNAPDGRSLMAIGCAEGVWVRLKDNRQLVKVLHLRMVTQCAVLEDFGFFLVLADKVLYAYRIEALVPSSPEAASASQTSRRLSKGNDVQFFVSGNVGGRTLIIYMKEKTLNSVFRVLEPVMEKMNARMMAMGKLPIGSLFSLWAQQEEWFRVYREFFLPYDSHDLLFLKEKIVVLSSKGFEILGLSDLTSVIIPLKDDPRLKGLAKRIRSCKPMGMFKLSKNEFLLCYDEFGLYVDNHGDPSRVGAVEWEGTAERVARYSPYILLFNSRFIEVRHAKTGRLVQIISGDSMRCVWDNRGMNQSLLISKGTGDDTASQELRVYGVMNAEAPQPDGRGATTQRQRVFELVPTGVFCFPGSLGLPSRVSYLKQSNSPPLSLLVNPEHPFRQPMDIDP